MADFHKLAERHEIHAGIVLVDGGLLQDEQLAVLRRVLEPVEPLSDLIRRALSGKLEDGSPSRSF